MTIQEKIKGQAKIDIFNLHKAQEQGVITEFGKGKLEALEGIVDFIDSMQEESVSEDLMDAAIEICSKVLKGETTNIDGYEYVVLSDAEECFKAGAKWKADQFEKERLKHCDALTKEQAQIESDFVVDFIKKNNRTPTFIDAIEYGMKLKLKDGK